MKVIKTWTITEEIDDEGKSWIKRVNDGFSAYEWSYDFTKVRGTQLSKV